MWLKKLVSLILLSHLILLLIYCTAEIYTLQNEVDEVDVVRVKGVHCMFSLYLMNDLVCTSHPILFFSSVIVISP